MFGYISADQPELRVRELETFKCYYCGLCRAIRADYSQAARLLLNYDCAFLYLLTSALTDQPPAYPSRRCGVHPAVKKAYAVAPGASFAAAMNVLLGVGSLRDKARDDKNLPCAAGAGALGRARRKAAVRYPMAAACIDRQLEALSALEHENCADLDRVADAFAALLAGVFEQAGAAVDVGETGQMRALHSLGYHLGRWIYLMDAYDDLARDAKRGSYNPLLVRAGGSGDEARALAEFNLNCSLAGAVQAYDLLDIRKHKGILDNILYAGLHKKTQKLLGGKNGSV